MPKSKRKMIGYFEGSDALWLTTLTAQGYDTLPVSNGYDGHGKNVRLFSKRDKVDAIVGYLHKVVTPPEWETTTKDILHACTTYDIPVLLAVPKELRKEGRALIGRLPNVRLVDPAEMLKSVHEVVK